jgi:broad specificity polyphosphatase/5'/3'-nucleotidase SurE
MLRNGLFGEICLNVNLPVRKIKGMKITRQGCEEHIPHFNALDYRTDYNEVPISPGEGRKTEFVSDHQAIMEHYVSITPLQRDQTDYSAAQSLVREAARLFALKP